MENALILCGGTGAHVGVAFLRLHTLGYALGFFDQGGRPFPFPDLVLVDQDLGDGDDSRPSAWQLAQRLLRSHPGRFDWRRSLAASEQPIPVEVTPLPVGSNQRWYRPPNSTLASRFESSPLLPVLTSRFQREVDYSKGMMGSPALGSLLFRLKDYDERDKGLNHDESFSQLLKREGRLVVAGSGVGGTGASVGPTLANLLADRSPAASVMAVMVLEWFEFEEGDPDEEKRAKALRRNRMMEENANSALDFYGKTLAEKVAAVPVGMPERSRVQRRYTSDVGQPIQESFIHAVGALCAYRHYLRDEPFAPGLYHMGAAVEAGRLDGGTAIPGGTLQGLANQATTLTAVLQTWRQVLAKEQGDGVVPALYQAVAAVAEPSLVGEFLDKEIDGYRQHLKWLEGVLGIQGTDNGGFTREELSRERLTEKRRPLPIRPHTPPEEIAGALFQWTAEWVREDASTANGLATLPAEVNGSHWPELRNEAINVNPDLNGDLNPVLHHSVGTVLAAFVDPAKVSANGWPHPLAAADYFAHALEGGQAAGLRQLELMVVGLATGDLELRSLELPAVEEASVSLEGLLLAERRKAWPGLAQYGVFSKELDAFLGFNSPETLLCPVPFMDDTEDNRLWQKLWMSLAGFEDGAPWAEVPRDLKWPVNDLTVARVRAWVRQMRRVHQTGVSSPSWARIFEMYPGDAEPLPFGSGTVLEVYWGTSSDPERPRVSVSLPTCETGEIWVPPPGTPERTEANLLAAVPELQRLDGPDGLVLFSQVDFEMPERRNRVRGWWDEHLDQVQSRGGFTFWARTETGGLIVASTVDGILNATIFNDSHVLRRAAIQVEECLPLIQDPIPGSKRGAGQILYPDLPIRGDYLDLVLTGEGERLVEGLKAGEERPTPVRAPTPRDDGRGRQVLRWEVPLAGRRHPLPVEIRLEHSVGGGQEEQGHYAHWMVWPNFRSREVGGWKAYYLYEATSDVRAALDALWLEAAPAAQTAQEVRLRRRSTEAKRRGAYPLAYEQAPGGGRHVGGPPVAVSLRRIVSNQEKEMGLYLVPLKVLSSASVDVNVAIDFGTSHSAAAVRVSGAQPVPVELASELNPAGAGTSLTLHLSESFSHVRAEETEFGILEMGSWLPTYRTQAGQGFVPAELMLISKTLEQARADEVKSWVPLRDFTLPPIDLSRKTAADYLLTDFKWDAGASFFRGRETALREHYLRLFLELVLAEVVSQHAQGFPARPVELTFTYPLRSNENQVEALQSSLTQMLAATSESLGLATALKSGIGLYDESRAARITSDSPGEVCLIADLGGGTLDLLITGFDHRGEALQEVADSARLGGNRLLRKIAGNPAEFLPQEPGWRSSNGGGGKSGQAETELRAWMRDPRGGSSRLFGTEATGRPTVQGRASSGFEHAAQGERARTLIDRYVLLNVEYMARNLVAYLSGEWFPKVPREEWPRLRISVQLRGNGWRLWHQEEDYTRITERIRDLVRDRVHALWPLSGEHGFPAPSRDGNWEDAGRYRVDRPKLAPIVNVARQEPMAYREVKDRWHTHALVDLEVHRSEDGSLSVPWYTSVPFESGGSKNVKVERVSPPVPLSRPSSGRTLNIEDLEARLQGQINTNLRTLGTFDGFGERFKAGVAAEVWEAIFDSESFWPGKSSR